MRGDVRYPPHCGREFSIAVTVRAPQLVPRIPHFSSRLSRAVGSLLGSSPWMAEEAMDWWLSCSSIFFGQSRRPAACDPVRTLLECCATPRPRSSMTPSAWWSTLINWAGGCTRMMIKLQDLCCYFLQAFSVPYRGWNDCHKQPGFMAWLPKAAAVMPCRTATVVSWMLTSIACQLRLTMVSINQLPLTWSTIMYDATLARMGHGENVGARGEPRRDGVYVLKKQTL